MISVIDEAKEYLKWKTMHDPLGVGDFKYIGGDKHINDLLAEIEKRDAVVEAAEEIIKNSGYGHDELNLDPIEYEALVRAIKALKEKE